MPVYDSVKQGDTWSRVVGWYEPLPNTGKPDRDSPIDLTGYSAKAQFRRSVSSPAAAVSLTSPSSGLTIDAAAGTVTARLSPSQTAALDPAVYVGELEINNGTDNYTLVEWQLSVEAQVTI